MKDLDVEGKPSWLALSINAFSGDHATFPSIGSSFDSYYTTFDPFTKASKWNAVFCFLIMSPLAVVPELEWSDKSHHKSYRYPIAYGWRLDKYWPERLPAPCSGICFPSASTIEPSPLFIAVPMVLSGWINYIIIGFDDQVHSTFDTLTDSFNLPAVSFTGRVGWRA